MKNKLLITTALVGSVAFAGASFAETKLTGNVEATYKSDSRDLAADEKNGKSAIGMETNIGVVHTKDLDNGMSLKAGMNLETGNSADAQATSDVGYIEVSNGNFSVHVGQDYGNNLNTVGIPTVGDDYIDASAASLATNDKDKGEEAHDALHIGIAQKFEGGVAFINYAPSSQKNDTSGDSSTADAGGSITEIGVKASFEGVSVQLGQQEDKQDVDGGTTSEAKQKFISVGYSAGPLSVGAARRTYDAGGTNTSTNDYVNKSYGVTYAVNDDLSVGLQYGEASEGDDTVEEETTALSVGYSLGGMGIEFTYAQVDNIGAASGTNGDGFQIRTITKF